MEVELRPILPKDRKSVIDILNFYIENSYAAFHETPLPESAFDKLLQLSSNLPTIAVENEEGVVIGFGMVRRYSLVSSLSRTGELCYFIRPQFTGMGIGTLVLEKLIAGAKEVGMTTLLANACKCNEGSINFHEKHGFVHCGCFKKIGKKHGRSFDVVWLQKDI